ncbi:transglutaminase-like cysteine peptidase [Rhizobium sp. TRM95111]|uniref:transglutaminase-like cysteine peptidase n=1 Tax=Rhizobium alarense TaxID=2846851 RepID=UPI001F168AF9|nr:transglutaminase-like cysteine peptidase [Rhizobium alarense]MCF3640768.1 transglutaminase-like cysteine peptidase [Rhizobium alarense]
MARMIGARAAMTAVAAWLVTSTIAFPAPLSMQTGAVTSQPIGHYEFCKTNRSECGPTTRRVAPAHLTGAGWNAVRDINISVNRAITPMTDKDLVGQDELWAYPDGAGDCEDFVLLKRKKLMERGFSAADLLITVVRKPDGEGHAVLTVRTSEGDFILDNLENDVKLWSDTPYRYLKRQASFHAGRWVSIENGDTMMVSAVGK